MQANTNFIPRIMILIGLICVVSLSVFLVINLIFKATGCYGCYENPFIAGFSMILLIPSIYLISPVMLMGTATNATSVLLYGVIPILFIVVGGLLLKRKRWTWWVALVFLITEICFITYGNLLIYKNPSLYISVIILILLFLDRKSFWEIKN